MLHTICNPYLSVTVSSRGAELQSILDLDGTEYLWQGDPAYWKDRAPNLFPYIARLTEGKYILHGRTYEMDIHGFAKNLTFEAERISDSCICFWLADSEETRAQYPYHFRFCVRYALEGTELQITYVVQNRDEKTMYFAVGAHPGFRVPFETGTTFEDYELVFDSVTEAKRIVFSEDCFVTDAEVPFILEEGKRMMLRHELFDDDAVILRDMAKTVTLRSGKSKKGIQVSYPDMPYLGLWHMPRTNAPYVCIEPWSSLPSRKGIVEDLTRQKNLLALDAGYEYKSQIRICVLVTSDMKEDES